MDGRMDGVVLVVVGGWWSTMEETKNKTCELNDCVYICCVSVLWATNSPEMGDPPVIWGPGLASVI